jgi:hypothetical protein
MKVMKAMKATNTHGIIQRMLFHQEPGKRRPERNTGLVLKLDTRLLLVL